MTWLVSFSVRIHAQSGWFNIVNNQKDRVPSLITQSQGPNLCNHVKRIVDIWQLKGRHVNMVQYVCTIKRTK